MAVLKYWIWLATREKIRPNTAYELIKYFGSPEKIYLARENEFEKIVWLKKYELNSLADKNIQSSLDIIDFCRKHKVKIITLNDSEYPERLRNIYDPPIVLYILGKMPDVDEEAVVAMVGTRKCSAYGELSAEKIAKEYAICGGVIVTGMALGIDTAAAKGALKARGKVIAVLGSGIDVLYPSENRGLFKEIYRHGAIISEFAPGTRPYKGNFPRRNRIISGLALGVLVVEAPEKSGALITAARAAEQGRDVFAIPGDINKSTFAGSNALLRDGAILVTSGYEIAGEYLALYDNKLLIRDFEEKKDFNAETKLNNNEEKALFLEDYEESTKLAIDNIKSLEYIDLSKQMENLSEDERAVVSYMKNTAIHIDEIISKSGLPASKVLSVLTMLEIKGYVTQTAGKNFILNILTNS